jgi:cytochrome c-type biogenesis protein CcmE
MKKVHVLMIGVLAVMVVVVISSIGDASTYATFEEARTINTRQHEKKVHIVGTLKTDASGNVVGISPSSDKLSFSFLMVDSNNETQKVVYTEPMPPDFLRSEQVVVVGRYAEDIFLADQILLKCPSKYQEETVRVEGIKEVNL